MRSFIVLLICVVLCPVLVLSGCAERSADDINLTELIGRPEQSSPIVGFSQLGEESTWRMQNTQSILDAAEDAGVQLMYQNGRQKLDNQIKALRSFIAYKVDAIVLAPLVETGWEAVLQEAMDAGIPVILEDRDVSDAPEGAVVARTGPDFYAEGRKAAAYVLQQFKNTEGPVNIVELSGTLNSTSAQERHNGFRDTLGSRARYRIMKSISGDFMLSKGREVIRALLDQQDAQDIDVLFSHNYEMTLGAIEAMEERGLVPGKDIMIVTIEAPEDVVPLVEEGKISCAVGSSPEMGDSVLKIVRAVLDGSEVPEQIRIPQTVVTKETLRESSALPSSGTAPRETTIATTVPSTSANGAQV